MKTNWWVRVTVAAVTAGLILVSVGLLALGRGSRPVTPAWQSIASASSGITIQGDYVGIAKLQFAAGGVYSATLATPAPVGTGTPAPPALGEIDLALHLDGVGGRMSGYVALDHTMVYSKEATIMVTPTGLPSGPGTPAPPAQPLDIGPRVFGTFDGTTLRLESQQFSTVLAPAQTIQGGRTIPERRITRQFSLTSTGFERDDVAYQIIINGTYKETIWGYTSQPLTAVGTFRLSQLILPAQTPGPTQVATGTPPSVTPTGTPQVTSTATPVATSTPTGTSTPGIPAQKLFLPYLSNRWQSR